MLSIADTLGQEIYPNHPKNHENYFCSWEFILNKDKVFLKGPKKSKSLLSNPKRTVVYNNNSNVERLYFLKLMHFMICFCCCNQ
jgi:hypothetical protein